MRTLYEHKYFKNGDYSPVKTKDFLAQYVEVKKDSEEIGGKDRPYQISSGHISGKNEMGITISLSKEGIKQLKILINKLTIN